MDRVTLGGRIREERKKRKQTLAEFAETAGIGTVYLGEIERGDKMPSINTFIKIANILDMSADILLRDEIVAAKPYVLNEITEKLQDLTPPQLKMVGDVVNAMLANFGAIAQPDNDFDDEE